MLELPLLVEFLLRQGFALLKPFAALSRLADHCRDRSPSLGFPCSKSSACRPLVEVDLAAPLGRGTRESLERF